MRNIRDSLLLPHVGVTTALLSLLLSMLGLAQVPLGVVGYAALFITTGVCVVITFIYALAWAMGRRRR